VAGDRPINLDSGEVTSLGAFIVLSAFLPDGRIFVADINGVAALLCPQ
jgi:hypothetical protein